MARKAKSDLAAELKAMPTVDWFDEDGNPREPTPEADIAESVQAVYEACEHGSGSFAELMNTVVFTVHDVRIPTAEPPKMAYLSPLLGDERLNPHECEKSHAIHAGLIEAGATLPDGTKVRERYDHGGWFDMVRWILGQVQL